MTARTFAPQLDLPDDEVDVSWQIPQVSASAPAALAA
jgi:hypothetical protein